MNSAKRSCNGSSSSPCAFLRKLTIITAIAPTKTTAPKIIRPILHLDIRDFHHYKITRCDHSDHCTHCKPATQRSTVKETTNILRIDKPQCDCQEHGDKR